MHSAFVCTLWNVVRTVSNDADFSTSCRQSALLCSQPVLATQHNTPVQAYANDRGISIMGDMPIYVGGQSADVWAYQDLFELSADGAPVNVSGVPPDAFSETGQLWGSPLYDWQVGWLACIVQAAGLMAAA